MGEDVAPGEAEVSAVLTVTPAARGVVLDARAQEADAERLALWVEVTGARDGAYTYDIYFQAAADAGAGDRRRRATRAWPWWCPSRAWPAWSGPASTGPTKATAVSSS